MVFATLRQLYHIIGTCKKPLSANESLKDRVTTDPVTTKKDKALAKSFFMAESLVYTIY